MVKHESETLLQLALKLQSARTKQQLLAMLCEVCVQTLGFAGSAVLKQKGNEQEVYELAAIASSSDSQFSIEPNAPGIGLCHSYEVGKFVRLDADNYVGNAGHAGILILGRNKLTGFDPSHAFQLFIQSVSESFRHCTESEQLRDRNQRLTLATKAGGIGTWDLDTITGEVSWDDQMFRLFEVERSSGPITYAFFEQHLDSDEAKNVREMIENYLDKGAGGPLDFQFRITTPGGRTKKIAGYANVKNYADSHPHLIGVNYDITEIEIARTQSIYRSQLENLLINLSIEVIRSGPDDLDNVTNEALEVVGRFVGADRAYRFSYDFDSEVEVANNTHEWCNEGIQPEIENLQGIPIADIDVWVSSHKRGLPMYVVRVFDLPENHGLRVILEPQGVRSIITIPLMDGGKCVGFIGFDSVRQERHWNDVDVNLLKLLADLLINAEMKARNERVIQQAQQALLESRDTARYLAKEAVAASVAKSRFVASVSHEIRTPLHAIIGIADLTLEESQDTHLSENLKSIRQAGSTLLELINDVLDFSTAEANEVKIKHEAFPVSQLVENLQNIFQTLAAQKNISFDINVQPGLPEVLIGDQLRIQQILSNLIGNAVKFTDIGGITLNILMAGGRPEFESELVRLEFQVIDTGVGIADSDKSKIFDPFFKGEEITASQLGGTGLGLPISYLLATKMGGAIRLESKRHQGSKFILELALSAGDVKAIEVKDQRSLAGDRKLYGINILLAEDNPVNQQLLRTYLRDSGCHLDIVMDGEQALDAYQKTHYDLILMDCRMPNLDGFETTKIIRLQEPSDQHVPILAVTASAMEDDRETCLRAGMDDVLTKPFTKNDLLKVIKKWI